MPKKLTQAEFLTKAVTVHGVGRYDYSQVVYVNAKTKVEIICPEHGAFQQTPGCHLALGRGCSNCGCARQGEGRRVGLAQFITRARAAHGDKYDYSQTNYTTSDTKVTVICPTHGAFEQLASSHLKGMGCARCVRIKAGVARRLPKNDFITRARQVHGDKYDYSQAIYTKLTCKVTITCPLHGSFSQRATDHLKGGCLKCGGRAPLDTASFVARAREVHGDKYDYSQAAYKRAAAKVQIVCPEHGVFEQTPNGHLGGAGCPTCAGNTTYSTADFLHRARQKHGDTYNYSQTHYVQAHAKVRISCALHGEFEQTPNAHARGAGCPQCAKAKKGLDWMAHANGKMATLYLLRIFGGGEEFYKVGITAGTVAGRYSSARDMPAPYEYEILAEYKSTNAAAVYEWEQSILETFAHLKHQPKRRFGGETECFSSADEILDIFPL